MSSFVRLQLSFEAKFKNDSNKKKKKKKKKEKKNPDDFFSGKLVETKLLSVEMRRALLLFPV